MAGKNLLEIILRLVDQASAPFRKASKEVKQGSEEMAQGHEKAAKASDKAAESIGKAGQASEETGNKHHEHSKKAHELEMGYMILAGAATAAYAVMIKGITASVEAHNREVAAFTGLRSVVIGTGKDYDQAATFVKSFTDDGLIAQAQAATALKNLLTRGFSLDQAIDMLNRLKDAAAFGRQSHLSMADAVQSATEGIRNENSILVDNAGVTKNVSVMWKEYAAQIGKSVDKLTLAEKRQAEYNGIMEETRHQVGDASKLADELGGQMARAGQATEKAAAAMGGAWAPAIALGAKIFTGLMNLVREAAERFPGLTFVISALAVAVTGMTAAWLAWMAVQGPVRAAMAAITAQAGTMWAAITGPVGIALAAIAAIGAALYTLANAQTKAAEAAVRSAKEQADAARQAADAARNKAQEIVRQESDLQKQITDLEKQASKQRAEIAKRDREQRRQEANRFGDLIVSALRKQHQAEQDAEEQALSENISSLKEFYDKRLDDAKTAHDKELDALRESLDTQKDAIKQAADEQRDLLRKQHDDAVEAWQKRRDDLRNQQSAEVDLVREGYSELRDARNRYYDDERDKLRTWQDEQERAIRSVYTERLRALDAETAGQVDAVQAQIDAIDQLTSDEEKAQRRQQHEQKISQLEAKALAAQTEEERTRYLADAADERAQMERDALLEARDAQKESLRQQIEEIRKNAEERRQALKDQQELELENLRQNVAARQKILDDQHAAELRQIDQNLKAALVALEAQQKAQLEALDQEKKALDEKYKTDMDRVDQLEKEQIASADRVYKEKQAALDKALAAEQKNHDDTLAALADLEKQQKEQIHEKYFGKDGLLNEDKLYAEALKLVMDNNQKEILDLLNTYEPDWQNQGKDFVQRLADGGNEAKPEVEALAEAINILLQASTENVLSLQDAAGDGAAQLAEINSQLDQAKQSLAELQATRRQAEQEAEAADQAAKDAEQSLKDAQEALDKLKEEQQKAAQDAVDTSSPSYGLSETPGPSGPYDPGGLSETPPVGGSHHGGGDVVLSGNYRLLEGEKVLSRSQAKAWERLRPIMRGLSGSAGASPRLTDLSAAMAGAGGSMAVAGGATFNLTVIMKDPVVRDEPDIKRLAQATSQEMLRKIRENGGEGG